MEFDSVFIIYEDNIKIVFKKQQTIIYSENIDFYIEKFKNRK